jgi:hypothetical protein
VPYQSLCAGKGQGLLLISSLERCGSFTGRSQVQEAKAPGRQSFCSSCGGYSPVQGYRSTSHYSQAFLCTALPSCGRISGTRITLLHVNGSFSEYDIVLLLSVRDVLCVTSCQCRWMDHHLSNTQISHHFHPTPSRNDVSYVLSTFWSLWYLVQAGTVRDHSPRHPCARLAGCCTGRVDQSETYGMADRVFSQKTLHQTYVHIHTIVRLRYCDDRQQQQLPWAS